MRRTMERRRRIPGSLRIFGIAILALTLVLSCGKAAPAAPVEVLLDEAFSALLPETAKLLIEFSEGTGKKPKAEKAEKSAVSSPAPAPPVPNATLVPNASPIPVGGLDKAMPEVLERWNSVETRPGAAIASPLAASKLARTLREAGGTQAFPLPPLIVPFAGGFSLDKPEGAEAGLAIHAVEYDFSAAYSAMGRKAARFLRRVPAEGGSPPVCGFVFQENFMRGGAALDAFVEAFESEIGEGRLELRTLDPANLAVDPSGTARDAIASLMGEDAGTGKAAVIVLAIADSFIARSAAAESRKLIFLADQSPWGEESGRNFFRYSILPDGKALARAIAATASDAAEGRPVGTIRLVPLRRVSSLPKIF